VQRIGLPPRRQPQPRDRAEKAQDGSVNLEVSSDYFKEFITLEKPTEATAAHIERNTVTFTSKAIYRSNV